MKLGNVFLILVTLFGTLTAKAHTKMIVKEWDLLFPSEEAYQAYLSKPANKLIVNTVGAKVQDVWNKTDRMRLTYCVSDAFKERKKDVVEAMKVATSDWMDAANVKFIYVPAQDTRCTNTNLNVLFAVVPVQNQGFLAAAFFPSSKKSERVVQIDSSSYDYSFVSFSGFLRHELGHALGFRHEHIVSESRNNCSRENSDWTPVTKYDALSVMHYPQCGGKGNIENMILSELDKVGARKVYP